MDAAQILMMPVATAPVQLTVVSMMTDIPSENSDLFDRLVARLVSNEEAKSSINPDSSLTEITEEKVLERLAQGSLDPVVTQFIAAHLLPEIASAVKITELHPAAAEMPEGVHSKAEVQPQAKAEVQPQARVEVQPQARVEVQPQAKAEVQPQAKAEVQPQARVEVQPQARVEVQPQAQARVEVDAVKPAAVLLTYDRPVLGNLAALKPQTAFAQPVGTSEMSKGDFVQVSGTKELMQPAVAVKAVSELDADINGGEKSEILPQPMVPSSQTSATVSGKVIAVDLALPEKQQLSDQVAKHVMERVSNVDVKTGSEQRVTFRLAPEHLGEIQLSVYMERQGVRIEVIAEHRTTRDALLQQTDELRETLARQNIRMDAFDVSTGNSGNMSQQPRDWRQLAAEQQLRHQQGYVAQKRFSNVNSEQEVPIYYIVPHYQSTIDVRF